MVVRKSKKVKKQRGHKTHGWGAKKKHRGAGHRGGRGRAGSGKRGDAKKPSVWKEKYFGKYGFKKKGIQKGIMPVNLDYFEKKADNLLADKLISKEGDFYVIVVQKLGFNKVLGCGKLTKKYRIESPAFSKKAVEKIKKAGGEVTITKKKGVKKEEEPQEKVEEAK